MTEVNAGTVLFLMAVMWGAGLCMGWLMHRPREIDFKARRRPIVSDGTMPHLKTRVMPAAPATPDWLARSDETDHQHPDQIERIGAHGHGLLARGYDKAYG